MGPQERKHSLHIPIELIASDVVPCPWDVHDAPILEEACGLAALDGRHTRAQLWIACEQQHRTGDGPRRLGPVGEPGAIQFGDGVVELLFASPPSVCATIARDGAPGKELESCPSHRTGAVFPFSAPSLSTIVAYLALGKLFMRGLLAGALKG